MVPNNKTIERYTVAEGKSPGHLGSAVEVLMRKGFQPYGPTLQHGLAFAQVMVVYKEVLGFLGVIDEDSPYLLHPDEGEAWVPEPYSDPDPFIIRNVIGNWQREIHRSESPYTLPDTPVTIEDTDGNVLLVTIVSSIKGEKLTVAPLPAADADVTVNTVFFGSATSGGDLEVPVVNTDDDPVGAIISGKVVVPDATFSIDGTQVDTVASGADLDVTVTLDGNPTTPTYNSGTKVLAVTGGTSPSISIAVSDTTPNAGDTITITATPSAGYSPTAYVYWIEDGTVSHLLAEQAGNTLNVLVDVLGDWTVRVESTDGTDRVFGTDTVSVQSAIPTNGLVWWADPIIRQRISGLIYEDFSAGNLLGRFVNAPVLSQLNGGSVDFNGITQRIDAIGGTSSFAFVKNTHEFTFAAFVRWDNLTQRFLFGNAVVSAERGFVLGLDSLVSNRLRIIISRGASGSNIIYDSPVNAITDTDWHHIAITCDGIGSAQWYIDGVPVTTTTTVNGTAALGTGSDTRAVEIGAASYFSEYFNGEIGPSLMWNRELTPTEVTTVFDNDKSRYGF
jgi:hypothetical protein